MRFDHYARMQEIHDQLTAWCREYPGLCSLSSIGQTWEGREMELLTVTDASSGDVKKKPAFFMDGNIHSGEVASSMAVMYCVEKMLREFGKNAEITRLLREYKVYALPRINADAAEVVLTTPRMLRGSTEPYYPQEDGVIPEDMDGDGEICQVRVQDPAGKWKAWEGDARIMLPRAPEDTEGIFYTLLPEGRLQGGPEVLAQLREARPREDLDPNRQFPFEWNPEYPDKERPTSGPAPLHDREVQTLAAFVESHPEIVFNMNFHTYGGLHISPAVFCPHLETEGSDLAAMRELGWSMQEKTGYKSQGIFPEGAKDIAPGSYTTWEYYELGIMAFVTELWDFHAQTDPERPADWSMFFSESREQTLREARMALEWDEKNNAGKGFHDWKETKLPGWPEDWHLEIGGWCSRFVRNNPPPAWLESVCRKAFDAVMVSFRAFPRLGVVSEGIKSHDGKKTLDVLLENRGYLPVSGTVLAEKKERAGLRYALSVDGNAESGPVAVPALGGYSRRFLSIPLPDGCRRVSLRVWGEKCGEKQVYAEVSEEM